MAKPNFTLPNKPAIKSGSILSYNYTDDFTFVPAPLTFNRDSAATRVNEKGLIEDVGYFGSELVQNGDFSEIGPELVTNGNFDNGLSGWSAHVGSTLELEDGKAKVTTVSAQGFIKRTDLSIQSGKTYFCTAQITNALAPRWYINGVSDLLNLSLISENTYGAYVTTTGNDSFFYIRGNNTDGEVSYIDNVSVKEVGQNWTLTQATVEDGKLLLSTTDGSYTAATQTLGTIGNLYRITLDVSDIVGTISVAIGGGTDIDITTNGTHTFEIISASTTFEVKRKFGITNVSATIDNISVIEILGDKPRIDYSDSLTEPSLLLEPQSTNLIPYSEDFSQWPTKNGLSIESNTQETLSPQGIYNATKITATTTDPYISYFSVNVTAVTHTASVYVKGVGNSIGKEGRILFWYIGTATGSTTSIPFTLTSEWQRVDGSSTPTGAGTLAVRVDFPADTAEVGDVGYLYGFQCEPLSYATSYIPTAGSTATRLGETANNAGDVNVFNSEEGVLYVEMAKADVTATEGGVRISRDTSNEIRLNFATGNRLNVLVNDGGSNQVYMDNTSYNLADYNKIAIKYKLNDYAVYVDGTEIHTDTNATVPTGLDKFNFHQFYGKVKNVQVFNKALTDRELEILTIQ